MKKIKLTVVFIMLLQLAFAGGLLTNYNQSAQYIRMLSRNASLDVDAVFYNPAGLVKLEDGWHFSFSSQTIWQTREVTSNFPLLMNDHDNYYEGKTFAPVFPDFYGVYKKNKWAFSLGVGPAAGGGSAKFENGLPSFEIPISKLPVALAGLGQIDPSLAVSGYSLDMSFDASSIFWGIQLGATYAIDDIFSIYGGVRVLPSTNTYNGSLSNISVTVGGQSYPAQGWLNGAATTVSGIAGQMQVLADMPGTLNPYLDAAGGYTLTQLETAGQIDATMKAGIEAGLHLMDIQQEQIDAMTLNQIYGAYVLASPTFQTQATILTGTSQTLGATANQMGDKEVDAKQKGWGVTPIIAINISPNEDWNVAMKYEHKTSLKLKNETKVDDMGLFPDGAEVQNDIPGLFTVGVGYRGLDWMELQFSYSLFLDRNVDWGYNVRYQAVGEALHREIDKNSQEVSIGSQFNLSDKFSISVGGLYSSSGVAQSYQSDFSYSNEAYAIAGGLMWKISDKLTFDAGVSRTFYVEDEVGFIDPDIGPYTDTYQKSAVMLAAGITFSIF